MGWGRIDGTRAHLRAMARVPFLAPSGPLVKREPIAELTDAQSVRTAT